MHFSTVTGELVGYNFATRQVVLRTLIPALDPLWIEGMAGVSDGIMFGDDGRSVFAVDVSPKTGAADRMTWRVKAPNDQQFGWVVRFGDDVWAYRDDNVLLQLDRSTGKSLSEYPLLWVPIHVRLDGDRLYAFTSDGQAYAMQLKAAGK